MDKQLKGTFELLHSKYRFKENDDDEDYDLPEDEEEKDYAGSESVDTLLKMDEEPIISNLKKNKKKMKIVKESSQDQVNLVGPIKVEIDITADMAKKLNTKRIPTKMKLENKSEEPIIQKPTESKELLNIKKENEEIQEIQKTKEEDISKTTNTANFNQTSNNGFPSRPLNMNMMANSLMNGLNNPQNNIMLQAFQESYMKSFMPPPQMSYYGMMDNPFANQLIYQEYLKAYMESMKKVYENNIKK